jgi:hypothetical protein
VRLHGEDRHELRAEATVVWARSEETPVEGPDAPSRAPGGPPGMGLQFSELGATALEQLRRILAQEQRGSGAVE